jgi:hypothetical protein
MPWRQAISEIGSARRFIFCLFLCVSRRGLLECEAAADMAANKSKSEVHREELRRRGKGPGAPKAELWQWRGG